MIKRARAFAFASGMLFWLSAVSYATGPGTEIWDALVSARPMKSGLPVSGTLLVRDVFTFRLESGAFFPLTEISGRIVGGVFKGRGRFELKPATEGERRFLSLRSRQKDLQVLSDSFEQAVFLFCDGSGKELSPAGPAVSGDEKELASVYH